MSTHSALSARSQARWAAATDEHQVALAAYLHSAGALPEAAWNRPWGEGKWTPAQITEHLSRAYEALRTELRDGRPMQVKIFGWRRLLTRWVFLPHILFHRSSPVRVAAPREVRPGEPRAPRDGALRALRELGDSFTAELGCALERGCAGLTHPYFGKVEPIKAMRFVAIHMDHHRRQLERATG